jgi:hypothetical protein
MPHYRKIHALDLVAGAEQAHCLRELDVLQALAEHAGRWAAARR